MEMPKTRGCPKRCDTDPRFWERCLGTKRGEKSKNWERLLFVWKTWKFRGRIQMEWFIPVEIFWKKSNTFRGTCITFFTFLPKRPKFSVPFVWITSAGLQVERKRKIYWYFVSGTTQSRSCFRCRKKYQDHLTEIFHRNFCTNGKR